MDIFPHPTTDEQALTLALTLALTCPEEDDRLDWLVGFANELASGLDATTVELCKAAALERVDFFHASGAAEAQ